MPFDADPVIHWTINMDGVTAVPIKVYVSHFATCPNADKHRRARSPR